VGVPVMVGVMVMVGVRVIVGVFVGPQPLNCALALWVTAQSLVEMGPIVTEPPCAFVSTK
jgi:hypothetical protein